MMLNKITPIILSGGNGTRLFPMSRQNKPKQFIEIFNNKTMFSYTIERFEDKQVFNSPIILGNINHIDLIKNEINKNIDFFNNSNDIEILVEPKAMNTASAICSCVDYLYRNNKKDDIVLFLPADAYIKNPDLFKQYILEGKELVLNNKLVIFGINPLYPETGYGYIKLSDKISDNSYLVDKFIEKPKLEMAEQFLKTNQYLWNAGIFMAKVETLYNLFNQYQPNLLNNIDNVIQNSKINKYNENGFSFKEILFNDDLWFKLDEISIDYAIIEKLNSTELAVVSMNLIWSDIGSYLSLYALDLDKDINNNVLKGNKDNIFLHNTSNCYIKNSTKNICCSDVENLVIVEEGDTILIMNKNKSQNIKKVIEEIKNKEKFEIL